MKLDEFYRKALETLSLDVDEAGYVTVKSGDETLRVTVGKKFLVMATSEHVSTMDDNKVLFNPLQEDSIKGINPSMVKYKSLVERQLSITFNTVAVLLAKLAADLKLQKDASLELSKFISELNKLRKQNMKEIVTEDTIKIFNKVFEASYSKASNAGMVAVSLARGKVIDGEKFNKVASLCLPLYEDLLENPKYAYDIEIKRPTDSGVLKTIIEYIVGVDDENKIDYSKFTIGSNSLESPTFISVYKTYVKLAQRLNKILKQLSFIDKPLCKAVTLKVDLAMDDLQHIESFKSQLRMIPKINDNSSVTIPPITKGVPASSMPTQSAPANINHATRAPVSAAPLSAMQKKLMQMRGQVIPGEAAPVASGYGYNRPPAETLISVRNPGQPRVMDPASLARLNAAISPSPYVQPGYDRGYPPQGVSSAGFYGQMNPAYQQPYQPYVRNR